MAQKIDHDTAFNWWVNAVLKKRLRMIPLAKNRNARYLKKTHKFGIEVPKSIYKAYDLDENNGDTLWANTIVKDTKDVSPDSRKLYNGYIWPIVYQCMKCHMIFDVKMKDLSCKARLVTGEHVAEPPSTITYVIIVSRETVRTDLTLASMTDFPVKVVVIQNAYITAPIIEKIWKVLGPEFGEDARRKSIVARAPYGLNSAGSAYWDNLVYCLHHLVFIPCTADLDIWMEPMVSPEDGFNYYAYVLIYLNDVMVIHH